MAASGPLHERINNGVSAKELERLLGVTYKTAWFMAHRLCEAIKPEENGQMGGGGTIEADETYWVNTKRRSKAAKDYKGRGSVHKEKIFSLVERGGVDRFFHVPDVTANTLKSVLLEQVSTKANFVTDEATMSRRLVRNLHHIIS